MRSSPLLLAGLVAVVACGQPPSASTPARTAATTNAREAPHGFRSADIDAMLANAWARASLAPAPPADDATYLRRVTIDVTGTVPTLEATKEFLASTAPGKRAQLVEDLLASPAYADHWMNYWDDVLMGRAGRGNAVDRIAFRSWLRARFAANAPWDGIVRDLVDATGENSEGGPKVGIAKATAMTTPMREPFAPGDGTVNGAVNFTLRFEEAPLDLAGNASRVFLGVQIQCAQCHDHKTETWKQTDFRQFAAAFLHTRLDADARDKGDIRRIEVLDLDRVAPRFAKNADLAPVVASKAVALDGTVLEQGKGTRKALAAWMTARENPWFARAYVNRMWGHFLGRGFTNPVDDMRPSNPGAMPELLDALAADFVANDFDAKDLIRKITRTRAYGLAASGATKISPETDLWQRFHIEPLGPYALLNAIDRATNLTNAARTAGIADMDQLRAQIVRQYGFLFDVDEETEQPDYTGTVSQALALLNGQLVGLGSRAAPGSALDEILAKPGSDADHVRELCLRALAREPTADERARWTEYVSAGKKPGSRRPAGGGKLARIGKGPSDPHRAPYEDLLWAMINSSEFVFNH